MKRFLIPALILAVATAAHADLTFTLDQSVYGLTLPSTGTTSITISGTVTGEVGDNIHSFYEPPLQHATPYGQMYSSSYFLGDISTGVHDMGAYTGPIVTYTFSATDYTGSWYCGGMYFETDTLAQSNTQSFEINVDAAPVPEPASYAALGLGAAVVLRRRRKA